jgi:AraC-like DNA-binding protein
MNLTSILLRLRVARMAGLEEIGHFSR